MLFWIIAGIFTLLTIGITIFPVFRGSTTPASPLEYDKEIYKARLGEIKNERDRGTISEKEYEYSLSEEGRRFLTLVTYAASQGSLGKMKFRNPALIGVLFAGAIIPLSALTGYSFFGSPNKPDQPLSARLAADPQQQSGEVLLQRAENQLRQNPEDGRGWFAVARAYMRIDRVPDAINAFRTAIRILGASSELQSSLGEALTTAADGAVTEEARVLFNKAVAQDPNNVRAKFFLAIALGQADDNKSAVLAWKSLIEKSPKDAPWLDASRQYLQHAQNKLGGGETETQGASRIAESDVANGPTAKAQAPGNPTDEDVRAAGQLSSEDRQELINSMVERLAQQLKENPNNKAGWRRIIRSYTVLGRTSEARSAIQKAQQIFNDDQQFLAELERNKQVLN